MPCHATEVNQAVTFDIDIVERHVGRGSLHPPRRALAELGLRDRLRHSRRRRRRSRWLSHRRIRRCCRCSRSRRRCCNRRRWSRCCNRRRRRCRRSRRRRFGSDARGGRGSVASRKLLLGPRLGGRRGGLRALLPVPRWSDKTRGKRKGGTADEESVDGASFLVYYVEYGCCWKNVWVHALRFDPATKA